MTFVVRCSHSAASRVPPPKAHCSPGSRISTSASSRLLRMCSHRSPGGFGRCNRFGVICYTTGNASSGTISWRSACALTYRYASHHGSSTRCIARASIRQL